MTFTRHLRLAGGVLALVGFFMQSMRLILIGLVVQYIGTIWGVDFLENRVKELENDEQRKD